MMSPSPQSWRGQGLCRTEGHPSDWDDFLDSEEDGERAETKQQRAARHEKAKAVCRRCPVMDLCAASTDIKTDEGIRFGELISSLRDKKSHRAQPNYEIVTDGLAS